MIKWDRYVLRNYKKTFMLVWTMVLGIFLMSLTNIIINSVNSNVYKAWAKPFTDFYVLEPIKETNINDTENYYSIFLDRVFITGVTGRISTYAFFVKKDAREYICNKNGVEMIEGKYPASGSNEIIVSKEIAKSKGICIGDYIGKEIQLDESLIGKYQVVGIFEAEGVFTIGDYDYYKSQNPSAYESIMINKQDVIYNNDDVGVNYNIYSYETEEEDIVEYGQILTISMIVLTVFIYFVIIFIILFVIYIYYSQRKNEYGILMAIGYKKSDIITMAIKEVLLISTIALSIGIAISLLTGFGLNVGYFEKMGQSLVVCRLSYFYVSFGMIALIAFFSGVMITKMISKIDCISLIEGE